MIVNRFARLPGIEGLSAPSRALPSLLSFPRAWKARFFRCRVARLLASLVVIWPVLTPTSALTAPINRKMEVKIMDQIVGRLDITGYDGKKTAGGGAMASIDGNFEKENNAGMAITMEAEDLLKAKFPKGLTYLQTVMFMFDSGKQQKIFGDKNGNDLKGTFSDPPQEGYTLANGNRQFATDMTPWYQVIAPAGTPGASPPDSFDGATNQFSDSPTLPFGMFGGQDGLANLLMGMDGMLKFETALVGVKDLPPAGDEKTGTYKVAPLKTFMWGLSFTFMDDGVAGFTADDYKVERKDFMWGVDVTSDFRGAFDKAGDNSGVEWDVDFVRLPIVDNNMKVTWGSNNTDRKIFDTIPANGSLKFQWTKEGNPHPEYHEFNQSSTTEKRLGFVRPDDATVTDWKQTITDARGTSTVAAANLVQDSPFQFAPLGDLPQINYAVPDFSPIGSTHDLTIYTAVDLNIYLAENPYGLPTPELLTDNPVGATLDDLGLTIVDGRLCLGSDPTCTESVQGIYFATSEFVLDPLSPTGWVPSLPDTWLNSDNFITEHGLVGIGLNGIHVEMVPEPATWVFVVLLGALALLRRPESRKGATIRVL